MILQGLKQHLSLKRSDFALGHADQSGLVASLDWIVSRQALCHLIEPERTFELWRYWLKPSGHVQYD